MMVYVINMMVDDEYGCREAIAVYANRKEAEAWIAENQEMLFPWYCDDDEGEPLYTIKEFKIQHRI